jgi:co-chaperonin GroES (HSP10)
MTSLAKIKLPPPSILDQTLEDAFPDVDPGEEPAGSLLLLQIKRPALKTKGGIRLTGNDQQTEYDNTKVAKVVAMGPLAFCSRETGKVWPEGRWVEVGDYIRISQHNVRTWTVPLPGTRGIGLEERVVFGYMDELHIQSKVRDPMATEAFF